MTLMSDIEDTQRELGSLRELLVRVQESLGVALGRIAVLDERIKNVDSEAAANEDVGGTLDRVTRLHSEQGRTLDEAKARGQGPLQKVLGHAQELHAQESRLVDAARDAKGERRDDLFLMLEQVRQLALAQREILRDEIGKFEAQGLRSLLDQLDDLGQRQAQMLEKVLATRDQSPKH